MSKKDDEAWSLDQAYQRASLRAASILAAQVERWTESEGSAPSDSVVDGLSQDAWEEACYGEGIDP
jgi:hypothetical protein